MALANSVIRFCVLISSLLILATVFCTVLGKAEEDYEPEIGTGAAGYIPGKAEGDHEPEIGTGSAGKAEGDHEPELGTGTAVYDPAQIVAKALLCFNDKYIYSSCEDSYRLTASGNLDVPPEKTEIYCSGPCLKETHLVLNCVDNILTHFVFYNKATIQDVRATLHAGCGYGPERGDFNVEEHIQAEDSNAQKVAKSIVAVLGLMVIGHGLL